MSRLVISLSVLFCLMSTCAVGAEPTAQDIAFFESKIRPVLVKQCYKCHSANAKKVGGEFLLDTRAGMLAGGESGEVIVLGDPKDSLLIAALKHEEAEMPPKEKLPPAVVANFVRWIKMGAPDPRDGQHKSLKREIDIAEGRKFWAFQPIDKKVVLPKVKNQSWPQGDIDRFVLAQLEAANLKPSPDAERQTLLRRLYFDLVGLPPSPAEQKTFLADKSPRALERVVDRLLASDQFGERWARHWLDIARFGESNGNVRNATFPHAWRYRDYVIDAFNQNTPYDRFLTQQIAGDLLPTKTIEERDENRIATGFLALASKPNAKLNPNFRMDLVADQIDVTTQATMALTVGCARCHDHKFDPIPTRDYYAMAGIFQSSETLYGGGGNSMGAAPVTDLYALGEASKPESTTDSAAESDRKKAAREDLRRQAQLKVELRQLKSKKNATAAENTQLATLTKEFKALNVRIKSRGKKRGRSPKVAPKNAAMGVRDRQAIADSRINLKGEFTSLGETVPRGFVQVVGVGEGMELPKEQSGRLELARWLTSPQHPLTSRVMVNRIWLHLFGTGLVGTPDNFGIHGERPSHPQLLDYLAARFMDEGWNVKATIKQIVLSRAYAQSSLHIEKSFQADPYNRLVWRMTPRRLEGEPLRDAILAISGKLDLKRPAGSIVTKYNGALVQDKITTKDFQIESVHRSIYLPVVRNALPEMLGVFDIADPSLVVGRRNVTTVPAQELYLINNEFVVEHSRQTARRVLGDEQMTDKERVNWGYVATFGRQPTDSERNLMLNYLFEMDKELQASEQDAAVRQEIAWGSLFQALFASTEFRFLN